MSRSVERRRGLVWSTTAMPLPWPGAGRGRPTMLHGSGVQADPRHIASGRRKVDLRDAHVVVRLTRVGALHLDAKGDCRSRVEDAQPLPLRAIPKSSSEGCDLKPRLGTGKRCTRPRGRLPQRLATRSEDNLQRNLTWPPVCALVLTGRSRKEREPKCGHRVADRCRLAPAEPRALASCARVPRGAFVPVGEEETRLPFLTPAPHATARSLGQSPVVQSVQRTECDRDVMLPGRPKLPERPRQS